ncbi:CHAT domain-containing protein [Lactifluus subvellereus]|nr:CHAT domain-containing protein [Lactifluus subvellereus]
MDTSQGFITRLDGRIIRSQQWLSSNPYSHPRRRYNLIDLATALLDRCKLLNANEDLDKAILHITEANLLPFHPLDDTYQYLVSCFLTLARSLLIRFWRTRQPDDLKSSIIYSRHILNWDLPSGIVSSMRKDITVMLVRALGAHVEMEAGSAIRDIEEMVVLCRELLTLGISGDDLVNSILFLNEAASAAFSLRATHEKKTLVQVIDQVVDWTRKAMEMCLPRSERAFMALAYTLTIRFVQTFSVQDIQEAISLCDQVIASHPLGDGRNPYQDNALFFTAQFSDLLFKVYPTSQYLEDAISRVRTSLVHSSPGSSDHSMLTKSLADLTKSRSRHFHLMEHPLATCSDVSLEVGPSALERIDASDESWVEWSATGDVRRACSLTTIDRQIQDLQGMLSGTLPQTSDSGTYFCALTDWYLARFYRTDDIADLEQSIEWRQIQLASTPADYLTQADFILLGQQLFLAFQRNHRISLLEESISLIRHVVDAAGAQGVFHRLALRELLRSLSRRWTLTRQRNDLDECVLLLQTSIDHNCTIPSDKLEAACIWAHIARRTAHPSISTAYESAMSWMQTSLVFAPTLHTKHAHLVAVQGANQMPLAYASYRVQTGHLEQAVETLEQGRALLWSEMRGLRASIDQLSGVDTALATKLANINQDLEILMMSIPPGGNGGADGSGTQSEGGTDAFGQFLKKQRKLLDERDTLTSHIQGLPGFEDFLKTPSFDTLRAAASRGPVIIVIHCEWRSDILVVLQDSPPSLITTANDFYHKANELAYRLSDTRKKHLLESSQYQRVLRSVLEELYEIIGQPVIDKLHELNVPEQSRIWWCPTSVFCSLPLHAMGPIPSKNKIKKYFSDMYISSYTPTLSALIKSREHGKQTSDPLSLLVIAPPEKSLPGVTEEIKVIRSVLGSSMDTHILEDATSKSATQRLEHHRFAHFACHGVLEEGKPFDASFMLHGDDRFTLLDIVRSRLPSAEFALLSACHTAELTDGSIADEALHLTAAMQYCGFRSVVGTMWAMADTDGRDLAEYFYTSMFSGEDLRIPYYERSAKALRDAVQRLRREKRVGLERWVNFVHYGA